MALVNVVVWKEQKSQPSGLSLKTVDGKVIVASVTPKSPADGILQVGDELVKVAGDYVISRVLAESRIDGAAAQIALVVRRGSAKVSTAFKPSATTPRTPAVKPQLSMRPSSVPTPKAAIAQLTVKKARKTQPTGLKFVEGHGAQVYVAEVEVGSIAYGKIFPGDKVIAINDHPVFNLVMCESMCEGSPRELRLTVERQEESDQPQTATSTPTPTENVPKANKPQSAANRTAMRSTNKPSIHQVQLIKEPKFLR